MAKSKKKQKEEDQIIAEQEMAAPEKREGLYLICGLVALAIAVYTLIALISYVFTWAHDQSSFAGNEIFNSITTVENGGGKIGLWWANLLISKLFGLGAFIIPFFFFGVALVCLKIKKVRLLRLFFITIFGCILISVFFSFIFSFTRFDRWFGSGAGGSYGYYVNQFLKTMIGSAGTGAILIIAIIGWCIIINKSLIRKISGGITAVGNKVMEVGKGSELAGDLEGEEVDGDEDENGDLDDDEEPEELNFDDEPNQKLDPVISVVEELAPEVTAAGADVALEVRKLRERGTNSLASILRRNFRRPLILAWNSLITKLLHWICWSHIKTSGTRFPETRWSVTRTRLFIRLAIIRLA
ncbi:MAG: DNA translocase FtsK 4TM domain-containing protein [Bacteroidales bacterium]|nr:DNA translocase FtsK 4TM domain-containing protein [Bacteroidales bacterium]